MPIRIVRFHRLASQEYLEALPWFESRSPATAQKFIDEIDRASARISTAAESCSPYVRGTRWVKVRDFNYILYFKVINDGVARVLSVAEAGRRPGYWLGRLYRP